MTTKTCQMCRYLGRYNIPKTGRFCTGQPIVRGPMANPIIDIVAITTHYCAAFHARLKTAVEIGKSVNTKTQ